MAHFAKVVNGRVTQVIVADRDFFDVFVDPEPGLWLQTSYNTRGNQHPEGRPLRGNYAGFGYHYDYDHDVFYEPQPFPSWTLDRTTWTWQAPIPMPESDTVAYVWDESTQSWK